MLQNNKIIANYVTFINSGVICICISKLHQHQLFSTVVDRNVLSSYYVILLGFLWLHIPENRRSSFGARKCTAILSPLL